MRFFSPTVFLLVFLGCNNSTETELGERREQQPIIISDLTHTEPILLSKIFEVEEVVLCKLPEDKFLININDLQRRNGYTYVIDNYGIKGIYAFDPQGDFLFHLDKEGNGPGEYGMLFGFTISKDGKELIVLDNRKRIIIYDAFNGEFKREISLDFQGFAISRVPNGYSFIGGADGDWLIVTDENFKFKYRSFNSDVRQSFGAFRPFLSFEDKTIVVNSYDQNIYAATEEGAGIWRKLEGSDLSKIQEVANKFKNSNNFNGREFTEEIKDYRKIFNYIEFKDGVIISLLGGGLLPISYFISNFESNINYHVTDKNLIDDITYSGQAFFIPVNVDDNGGLLGYHMSQFAIENLKKNEADFEQNEHLKKVKDLLNSAPNQDGDNILVVSLSMKKN